MGPSPTPRVQQVPTSFVPRYRGGFVFSRVTSHDTITITIIIINLLLHYYYYYTITTTTTTTITITITTPPPITIIPV